MTRIYFLLQHILQTPSQILEVVVVIGCVVEKLLPLKQSLEWIGSNIARQRPTANPHGVECSVIGRCD